MLTFKLLLISHYLPHMKTQGSPVGLKPEFASWSLVLMGSSSIYSHSAGLGAMPGFMSSSKFLLPWEIPLTKVRNISFIITRFTYSLMLSKMSFFWATYLMLGNYFDALLVWNIHTPECVFQVTESDLAANWPNILEYIARRASILPSSDLNQKISVKVFVGFEYECPRGHR